MNQYVKAAAFVSISVLMAACRPGSSGDKKTELEKLKAQQLELTQKIAALEKQISHSDSLPEGRIKMVTATAMAAQPFVHYVEVQGSVQGDEEVTVSAQMMGTVTSVKVKAGDRVGKGQVMATLDDRTIRQSLESLRTQAALAATVYARQKNLWDQNIGSELQYLNAKAQKETLEKQLASLQEQWNMTRIESPISGTVDYVYIKTGETAVPGMPAIRVVNLDNLKVKAEVAESFINTVSKGNEVILYFPEQKREIKTRLDYAGKVINTLNRTFNVEVRLKKTDGIFYPNQVVILKIADYANEQAMVIPVSALQKTAEGAFVFAVESRPGHRHTARRKPVVAGKSYNGQVEITSGISAGDRIITFGSQNLVDGDPVSF